MIMKRCCLYFIMMVGFTVNAQVQPIDLGTDTMHYNPEYEYVAAIETADYMESYVFYRAALKAYQNNDLLSAKATISRAIRLNKNEAKFKILKAWILSKEGSYNKAIKITNKVLANTPKNQEAIYCKALNHFLLGSYSSAITGFNSLLSINPADHKALLGRAETRMKTKQYKYAIKDFSNVIMLKPSIQSAYKGRALAYFNVYDFQNAIKDFNQSIVAQPKNGQLYYYRGICNLKLSDFTNACKDFEKAVDLDYKLAITYLNKNCRL